MNKKFTLLTIFTLLSLNISAYSSEFTGITEDSKPCSVKYGNRGDLATLDEYTFLIERAIEMSFDSNTHDSVVKYENENYKLLIYTKNSTKTVIAKIKENVPFGKILKKCTINF